MTLGRPATHNPPVSTHQQSTSITFVWCIKMLLSVYLLPVNIAGDNVDDDAGWYSISSMKYFAVTQVTHPTSQPTQPANHCHILWHNRQVVYCTMNMNFYFSSIFSSSIVFVVFCFCLFDELLIWYVGVAYRIYLRCRR